MLRGTFRRDRHGDAPADAPSVPRLASVTKPRSLNDVDRTPTGTLPVSPVKYLSLADAPPELSPDETAMFAELIHTRPVWSIYGIAALSTYITSWSMWRRATQGLKAGDVVRQGNRAIANPFVRLQQQAAQQMATAAEALGWSANVVSDDQGREAPSRLQEFLARRVKNSRPRRR